MQSCAVRASRGRAAPAAPAAARARPPVGSRLRRRRAPPAGAAPLAAAVPGSLRMATTPGDVLATPVPGSASSEPSDGAVAAAVVVAAEGGLMAEAEAAREEHLEAISREQQAELAGLRAQVVALQTEMAEAAERQRREMDGGEHAYAAQRTHLATSALHARLMWAEATISKLSCRTPASPSAAPKPRSPSCARAGTSSCKRRRRPSMPNDPSVSKPCRARAPTGGSSRATPRNFSTASTRWSATNRRSRRWWPNWRRRRRRRPRRRRIGGSSCGRRPRRRSSCVAASPLLRSSFGRQRWRRRRARRRRRRRPSRRGPTVRCWSTAFVRCHRSWRRRERRRRRRGRRC